ncbi:DUF975 family protein [Bacillus sp. DX1.1]|uniref:DUF975 family protein n=1 Tax=unclassified Bacillus (in: firmicutes) TaxID=185979 RepID=UPI00257057CA|nr:MULTISPECIES: DUF975 family protein [unclassified Bacillus (in: firmicutes)]MDM5157424.1 DUF975 family protein [Bacillus sp. DX1.1]WJE81646.1 DUF975 family protein [Bacillus sp. DX3.1]
MIGEMKREALESLKGRWGLGVGATLLYYILSYVITFALALIFVLFSLAVGGFADGIKGVFYEEFFSVGALLVFLLLYVAFIVVMFASQGITYYGYSNTVLQLSRRSNVTIDSVFEGFRGFKRMMTTMKAMILMLLYSGVWIPFLVTVIFIIIFSVLGSDGYAVFLIAYFVLVFISIIYIIIGSFSYAMTFFVLIDHPEYPVLQAMKESKTMMKGHKMDLFLLWLSFIGWCVLAVFTLGFGFLWVLPYMYTTTAHFYQHVSGNESY